MGAIKQFVQYGSPPWCWSVRVPEWVWDYDHVTIHNPNLGNTFLYAFNETKRTYSSNITYGYIRFTNAVNGVKSIYNGGWSDPEPFESNWIWTSSPYVDGSTGPCWTNKDIYGWGTSRNPNAPDYLALAATEPTELVIETGWTDYGSDGVLTDMTNRNMTIYQGFSVAGAFRCRVNASNGEKFKFEWYENGKLVLTQANSGDYSDYKPSSAKVGECSCYCKVTALDSEGNPLKRWSYGSVSGWKQYDLTISSDSVSWKVTAYDSGDDSDGGAYGYEIVEEPAVVGIVTTVNTDKVAPGGHAFIGVRVNGVGNYNQAFTSQISGNTSSNTHLVADSYGCNIWVGADETTESITITFTSVQDSTITATETIYIDQSTTEEGGTDVEQLQLAFWKGYAAAKAMYGGVE